MGDYHAYPMLPLTDVPVGRRVSLQCSGDLGLEVKNTRIWKKVTPTCFITLDTADGLSIPISPGLMVYLHPEEPEDIFFRYLYDEQEIPWTISTTTQSTK